MLIALPERFGFHGGGKMKVRPSVVLAVLWAVASLPAVGAEFEQQWALENTGQEVCRFDGKNCQAGAAGVDIKAKQAWDKNADCSRVITAVLDSGVDQRHPDLAANLLPGKNFVGDAATDDPQDDNLHGTHVSGIIAGAGTVAKGVMGVCAKAKILPVKVGSAEGYLTDADVLEGIDWAAAQGAKVVNASFGGGPPSENVKGAIARAKDTLFIIAAGNGNMWGLGYDIDKNPVYPASYDLPNIVAVGATDNRDQLGKFSNFGKAKVHLAAPGVNILSTMPSQPTESMTRYKIPAYAGAIDGTSMATPYVAGAAALLWSKYPRYSITTIKRRLLAAVDAIPALEGKVQTGGRLNLQKLFAE